MTGKEYQAAARETAVYPPVADYGFVYPVYGLAGEAGEVAQKVGKFFRDRTDFVALRDDLKKELGDCLWFIAQIATEFDLDLDEIMEVNIAKLQSRKQRGTIQGSGDNR